MTRFEKLQQFLNNQLNAPFDGLTPITGDASFRCYYRVVCNNKQFIVMDSDPQKVNNAPYLSLNKVFTKQGFLLPTIIASDEIHGFFLLIDLGSTHLADMLNDENRMDYYKALIKLSAQWATTAKAPAMQAYDNNFIANELAIFSQWLVSDFIHEKLSAKQQVTWQDSCELLTTAMLAQPVVTVHRDYHSRNIMYSNDQWAIIDYQDSVQGPLCYDLVSLLRDCYFKLPEHEFSELLSFGYNEFLHQGLVKDVSFDNFKYWFDLTGMQRHFKAAGIFCRLYLRDGKTGYLNNILPTLEYIVEVANHYPELYDLKEWVVGTIIPKVTEKLLKVSS